MKGITKLLFGFLLSVCVLLIIYPTFAEENITFNETINITIPIENATFNETVNTTINETALPENIEPFIESAPEEIISEQSIIDESDLITEKDILSSPSPPEPNWFINQTSDWDAGTKVNTSTTIDYNATPANILVLKYGSVFNDNFDSETVGTTPDNFSSTSGAATALISSVQRVTTENSMNISGTGYFGRNDVITTQNFTSWLYFPVANTYYYLITQSSTGNLVIADGLAYIGFRNDGTILYYTGGAWSASVGTYTAGWHKFTITHNITNLTFDLWYDNTLLINDGIYNDITSVSQVNSIHFGVSSATLFVDDITVGNYYTTGTWTSARQTITTGEQLVNLTVNYSSFDQDHYIDRVEVLNYGGTSVANFTGGLTWNSTLLADTNLIGYWQLENNANDYKNYNTPTITGATFTTSGKFGGAYSFDGNDCLNTSNTTVIATATPTTVCAWIKNSSASQINKAIVGQFSGSYPNQYGSGIWINDTGAICAESEVLNDNAQICTATYPAGDWHFVCANVVTPAGKLFVDGQLIGTGNLSSRYQYRFGIGCSLGVGTVMSNYFAGTIDDVSVFNRNLTDDEIYQLYLNGKTSGSQVRTISNSDLSGGSFNNIINNFSTRLYLKGNGTSTPIVNSIVADSSIGSYQNTSSSTSLLCTWTGVTSTDWHTDTNWDCGRVPTALDSAILSASTTNQPLITANVTVVNVSMAGTLTVNTSVNSLPIYIYFNDTGGPDYGIGFRGNGNLTLLGTQANNIKVTTVSAAPATARHFRIDMSSIASNWTANWTDFDEYLGSSGYILRQNVTFENLYFSGAPTHPFAIGTSGVTYGQAYKWFNVTIPTGAYDYNTAYRMTTGIENSTMGDYFLQYMGGIGIESRWTTYNSVGYYAVSQNAWLISQHHDKVANSYGISMSGYNVPTTPSVGAFKKSSITLWDFGTSDNVYVGLSDLPAIGQFNIDEDAYANTFTMAQSTGSTNVTGGYLLNVSNGLALTSGNLYFDSGTGNFSLGALGLSSNSTLLGDANLVSYYQLDGNANDYKGLNDGVLGNATATTVPTLVTGKFQGAYDFDASDFINISDSDSLSFTDGANTDRAFSISAWVKADDWTSKAIVTKYNSVLSGTEEYTFYGDSTDKLVFRMFDDSASADIYRKYNAIALTGYQGQWIHVVGTYNGNETPTGISLYLNGVKVDDTTVTNGVYAGMENTPTNVWIGGFANPAYYMDGSIDEVAIFNRSLTDGEVSALYNTTSLFYQQFKASKTQHYNVLNISQTNPTGYSNLNKYVNATNTSTTSWLYLNLTYNSTNVSLSPIIMYYDGATWADTGSLNDSSGNEYVNFTSWFGGSNSTLFGLFNLETIIDTTSPQFTQNISTQTYPIMYAPLANHSFGINCTDETLLYNASFESNYTGTLTNYTGINSTSSVFNYSFTDYDVMNFTGRWICYDASGNGNATATLDYAIYLNNTIYPQIANLTPSNTTYASSSFWANVTTDLNGVYTNTSWCGVSMNSTANQSLTNSTDNWNLNMSNIENGAHNITFYCNNTNTNYTSNMNQTEVYNFTILIDTIAPIITISSPSNTTYANVTIWQNVTLDEEGSWCGVSVNGASNVTLTNSTGNWNYELPATARNSYSSVFCCNDTIGNINCSANVNYTVAYNYVTWLGTTSTDWHDSRNWNTSAVPNGTDFVILNATPTNQPIITQNVTIVNISAIVAGEKLTIQPTVPITIKFNDTGGASGTIGFIGTTVASLIFTGTPTANILITTVSASPGGAYHWNTPMLQSASPWWNMSFVEFNEYSTSLTSTTSKIYWNDIAETEASAYPLTYFNTPTIYRFDNVTATSITNAWYLYTTSYNNFTNVSVGGGLLFRNSNLEFIDSCIPRASTWSLGNNSIIMKNYCNQNTYQMWLSGNTYTSSTSYPYKKSRYVNDFGATDNVVMNNSQTGASGIGILSIDEDAYANTFTLASGTTTIKYQSVNVTGGSLFNVSNGLSLQGDNTLYFDSGIGNFSLGEYGGVIANSTLLNDVNLTAYWQLDGNANDYAGRYIPTYGVGTAMPTQKEGKYQSSYYFDGGDYINVSHDELLNPDAGNFSVSFWMKSNAGNGIMIAHYKTSANYDGWYLYLTLNKMRFQLAEADATAVQVNSVETINDDKWHHIVGVINRTGMQTGNSIIYVDGNKSASTSFTTLGPINYTTNLVFGRQGDLSGLYYTGYLDDVAIFNRSLSDAEIMALYSTRSPFYQTFKAYKTQHFNIQTIPATSSGYTSLGKFVNATNTSTDSWLQLNLTYNSTNTSLSPTIFYYDGATWTDTGSLNDSSGNEYVNFTSWFGGSNSTLFGLFNLEADTTKPKFYNNITVYNGVISESGTYYPNNNIGFQINCTDNTAMNNAFLETGGATNYTMSNATADIFTYNLTDQPVSTITYKMYCNDSSGNQNATDSLTFIINQNTSVYLQITNQSPSNTTYGNTSIWFNATTNLDDGSSADRLDTSLCWFNISATNTSMSNSTGNWNYNNGLMTDGTYNASIWCNNTNENYTVNTNYTSIMFSVDTLGPYFSNLLPYPTTPVYYPNSIIGAQVDCADDSGLYNATMESNHTGSFVNYSMSNLTLSASLLTYWANITDQKAGIINMSMYCRDTIGNENSTGFMTLTIGQNTTVNETFNLTINGTESDLIKYYSPDAINVTANNTAEIDMQDITFVFYRNSTPITVNNESNIWGVTEWNYEYNTTGNENYTAGSKHFMLRILQNTTNPVNLYLNGTLNSNKTYTYPESINATAEIVYTNSGTVALYRNDVDTSTTEENIRLGNGTYKYNASTAGNENYTYNETTYYVFVNKGTLLTYLALNGTQGDTSYNNTAYANISAWSNATIDTVLTRIYMNVSGVFENITADDVSVENITDLSAFTFANYNITANTTGNTNYTSSDGVSYMLTMNDTSGPSITSFTLSSSSITLGNSITITWNTSDNNNVSYVRITSTGEIINTTYAVNSTTYTPTSAGTETITLVVYDESGNNATSSVSLIVSAQAVTPSGGGGGGGGGIVTKSNFEVSGDLVGISLAQSGSTQKVITVKNTGEERINFKLDAGNLKEYIVLSESSFSLDPGEIRSIVIGIIGGYLPGLLVGKISVIGDGTTKDIPITMNVETEVVLFDAMLDLSEESQEMAVGGDLKQQVTLFRMTPGELVDVTVHYLIRDLRGNLLYEESETFAVQDQRSYTKTIELSDNIKPGTYVTGIEVRYANSLAVSSATFDIVNAKGILTAREEVVVRWVVGILIILGAVASFIFWQRELLLSDRRKNKKVKK